MRISRLALGAALIALAVAPARAQWQKNQYQLHKEAAARYDAVPIVAEHRSALARPRPVRVRFYADRAYRAANPAAQERLRGQFATLDRVVGPAFGIRFEVETIRRWDRRGPDGALGPMLDELRALDPGSDVDWVVGLVNPLSVVVTACHELGLAEMLGRHFVLRGMASVAERQAIAEGLHALDREQQEELYGRRKAHKELTVFLHEWAHTLGVVHVQDPTRIMSPQNSNRTSRFGASESAIIAAALEGRLGEGGQTDWASLRDALVTAPDPGWVTSDHAHILSAVTARAAARPQVAQRAPEVPTDLLRPKGWTVPPPAAPAPPPPAAPAPAPAGTAAASEKPAPPRAPRAPLSPVEREIRGLIDRGRHDDARAALGTARRADPAAAGLLALSCELALLDAKLATAAAHCEKARAARPKDPQILHLLGRVLMAKGDHEAAMAPLRQAVELDCHDQALWTDLGAAYRAAGRSQDYRKLLAGSPCPGQ